MMQLNFHGKHLAAIANRHNIIQVIYFKKSRFKRQECFKTYY